MNCRFLAVLPLLFAQPAIAETAPDYAAPAALPEANEDPAWAFEASDIPVDPAFRFGVLNNGMRYILRENATPEGTGLVRLHVGSGSLDETDSERGLAHFLEHMAFNGSTNVPEGEMVKLLEREGLAFGADTNASTGLQQTVYKLNLPRNDKNLLDTALMIMRETASELTIDPEAVERERGVILAERRDRRNFSYKELEDRFAFTSPGARFIERMPIGELAILQGASAEDLRGFYKRTYVPANTTLVVVGDFAIDELEQSVRAHFADWEAGPDPVKPETGPFDITRSGETDIYIDPALSERVRVMRFAPWNERADSVATRQQNLLRRVGYGIVNRRLQSLARGENAPFRGAGYGTGDVFEDGRTSSLVIDSEDGKWREGMTAATLELRRALQFGFSEAEVSEQVARIRTSLENAASASATRTHGSLAASALALIDNEQVPSTPESALARFESFAPSITAEATLAAILEEAAPLDNPLIRFRGRAMPEGGAEALRMAWDEAAAVRVAAPTNTATASFAYTDFGAPGEVVSDQRNDRFGFRLIRFANGVRLNLKQTDIREDRISFRLSLDGGQLMETREEPLKTALVSSLPSGGLGAHSQDELETVLAGRSVRLAISARDEHFRMSGGTTPRDLKLQLQLLAAALTDPGYRTEGEERYRRGIRNFFANLNPTPGRALGNAIGGILSDGDPRFTLQDQSDFEALTFEQLSSEIADRLKSGAIELALVGDFEEQAAIDAVAATIGALPPREIDFLPREDSRQRSFTADRSTRTVTHTGEPDQALVRMTWPTTDDSDFTKALRLALLNRIVRIRLQEQLREDLGKTYSPSSSSNTSSTYRGYGTFSLTASIDVTEVEATRAAIRTMLDELRRDAVDEDTLARARQPLLEAYDNMLKTLGGWMTLADNAQSKAERLDRFDRAPVVLKALTTQDMLATAQRYLAPDEAVEVLVLPELEGEIEEKGGE